MVIAFYLGYLVACTGVTIAVGAALGRSGRVVMTGLLGDERQADAVSRLLVVTLYLLVLGSLHLASLLVFARLRRRQRPPASQSGAAPPWAAPRERAGAGSRVP